MNLNILALCFLVLTALFMCLAEACRGCTANGNGDLYGKYIKVPIPKRKYIAYHRKFQQKYKIPNYPIEKTRTTLAPQIQEILLQAQDSPILKNKKMYKSLMKQLKEIFHTTHVSVCERCKTKTIKLFNGFEDNNK